VLGHLYFWSERVVAKLSRETVQRLAVLKALSLWQNGAYGPVRVHKVLFFTDKKASATSRRNLFTFKKWALGQYSDEIASALNGLRTSGRLRNVFDGPAERLTAIIPRPAQVMIDEFFESWYPELDKDMAVVFDEWGYLSNAEIIRKAHEDHTYTESEKGEIIWESTLPDVVEIAELSDDDAENLSDLVDPRLFLALRDRLQEAVKIPAKHSDWRRRYFCEVEDTL